MDRHLPVECLVKVQLKEIKLYSNTGLVLGGRTEESLLQIFNSGSGIFRKSLRTSF